MHPYQRSCICKAIVSVYWHIFRLSAPKSKKREETKSTLEEYADPFHRVAKYENRQYMIGERLGENQTRQRQWFRFVHAHCTCTHTEHSILAVNTIGMLQWLATPPSL